MIRKFIFPTSFKSTLLLIHNSRSQPLC